MRRAYLRAKKYQEIKVFESIVNVDKQYLYVDLLDSFNNTDGKMLDKLLKELEKDDILVIKSFNNFLIGVKELLSFITNLRDKGVKLEILESNERILTTDEGHEVLTTVSGLIEMWEKDIRYKQARKNRSKGYPDNFIEVFEQYLSGEIKSKSAAETLGIEIYQWYNLLKQFN